MKKAFTLIELLIVVAIIAILAAIAVPNFLEAQIRSKTSRAKADLRSLATGMESYAVDNTSYPPCNTFGVAINNTAPGVGGTENWAVLERLTTPIAYITTIFNDSFVAKLRTGSVYNGTDPQVGMSGTYSAQPALDIPYKMYLYTSTNLTDRATATSAGGKATAWLLQSAGPDLISINMGGVLANGSVPYCHNLLYDPTNGTISFGEIYRVGGQATAGVWGGNFYQTVQK